MAFDRDMFEGLRGEPRAHLAAGDCLDLMRAMPDGCVDLVFCSPPYEAQRSYGVGFNLTGQDWVDWAVERFMECLRISTGPVCWVIEGRTRQFQWSATPALLMADLHRAGVCLRKPPVYRRYGIPGSGGPDWLRNDYEFVVCATRRRGRLPWSDNTACGAPPKFRPGGPPTHRRPDGRRAKPRPGGFRNPKRANPGNVVDCGAVGGGNMGAGAGSAFACQNEAPFPERLAELFVRSFCPPAGIVLDPFCGSGTTLAVARKWMRSSIGLDLRESQVELSRRRLEAVCASMMARKFD